jgi:dUTP pyrophosphatase
MRVEKLHPLAALPQRATPGSAGFDLEPCLEGPVVLKPGTWALIPTGLAIQIPKGHVGFICTRSGMAKKKGIVVLNAPGVLDSDYTDEVGVLLVNYGKDDYTVTNGMRIAQLVLIRAPEPEIEEVDHLEQTTRKGGFGSTDA